MEKQELNSIKGKVVFFVPTVELVEQQLGMYRKYLPKYEASNVSGDIQDSQKVPLIDLVERYDVLVMTPQILVDSIAKFNFQSLSKFTLMIFDECHHTNKQHPYNSIMASYMEEKYDDARAYLLPQVILTAKLTSTSLEH
jgi:ATP-dependent RNA helicase DDX58